MKRNKYNVSRGRLISASLKSGGFAVGVVLQNSKHFILIAWVLKRYLNEPSAIEFLQDIKVRTNYLNQVGYLGFKDETWRLLDDSVAEEQLPRRTPVMTIMPGQFIEIDSDYEQCYVDRFEHPKNSYFMQSGTAGHSFAQAVLDDMVDTQIVKPFIRPFHLWKGQYEIAIEKGYKIDPRFFCPELGIEAKTPYVLPTFPYDHEGV